jgi:hypothetical protein
MDLSIIIVNYNTKLLTEKCIESVIKEGGNLKTEIIIVDNKSTDGSVKMLRSLWRKHKNIILIPNNKNLGFAKANNQGIKISSGKYILLLNSDTVVKKYTLTKLVAFAKSNESAGAVVPRLLNPDGTIQGSVFRLPTLALAIRQYWFGQKDLMDAYYPKSTKPAEVESAVMAAFLITPNALKQVGLLNENYFMFFEDHDYCRTLKLKGLKIYYLPDALVIHYRGASGKSITDSANQWRRQIPSSEYYHGKLVHSLIFLIIWTNQKFGDLVKKLNA